MSEYFSSQGYPKSMSTPYNNFPPNIAMRITTTSADAAPQGLPNQDRDVEGLGIMCESEKSLSANDSAIDVAYDNFMWQAQIDQGLQQFQQSYEQQLYQHINNEASNVKFEHPQTTAPTFSSEGFHSNTFEPNTSSTCSSGRGVPHLPPAGSGGSFEAQVQREAFPCFQDSVIQNVCPQEGLQPQYTENQLPLVQQIPRSMSQTSSYSMESTPYAPATVFHTPHLQPPAEIYNGYSRRQSISSNAPSSVFSSESHETPYFMTPSATPVMGSNLPMENWRTPATCFSSPAYPSHSRSPSSSSLKVPNTSFRTIRPAPYTLDASQRQRWSTGKSMSLPSRRAQPTDRPSLQGHMRSFSEQHTSGTSSPDDSPNDERSSFNKDLDIIRQRLPCVIPSVEQEEPEEPVSATTTESSVDSKTKSPSEAPPRRRILATIKPKIPTTTADDSSVPPLNLPALPRPTSPPPSDLGPDVEYPAKRNPTNPNDSYTPKYSRGTKGQLQGFCGLCKPGRWLNMKTSAYWYDKKNKHGINPKTKRMFDPPVERRWKNGSSVIREGLCGVCGEWKTMDSCKTQWTVWWGHAWKCHNQIREFEYEFDEENLQDQHQDLDMTYDHDASYLKDPQGQHANMMQMMYAPNPWFFPLPQIPMPMHGNGVSPF